MALKLSSSSLAAFFVVGLEMAGGGVVSHAGSAGYFMESGSGWFEPLPDLHMSYVHEKSSKHDVTK